MTFTWDPNLVRPTVSTEVGAHRVVSISEIAARIESRRNDTVRAVLLLEAKLQSTRSVGGGGAQPKSVTWSLEVSQSDIVGYVRPRDFRSHVASSKPGKTNKELYRALESLLNEEDLYRSEIAGKV